MPQQTPPQRSAFWRYRRAVFAPWWRDTWGTLRKWLLLEILLTLAGAAGVGVATWYLFDYEHAVEATKAGLVGAGATTVIIVLAVGIWHAIRSPGRAWDADQQTIKHLGAEVAKRDATIALESARQPRAAAVDGAVSKPTDQSPNQDSRLLDLLAEQARTAAVGLRPRFEFFVTYIPEPDKPDDDPREKVERLEVWNRGGALLDYDLRQLSFLIAYDHGYGNDSSYAKVIPVICDYDRDYTQNMSGLLLTLKAEDSLARELERIEMEFKEELESPWGLIQLKVLIQIDYVDCSGEEGRVSYNITPFSQWTRPNVPQRLSFTLSEARYDRFTAPVFLANLTGQQIKQRWDDYPTYAAIKYFVEAPS